MHIAFELNKDNKKKKENGERKGRDSKVSTACSLMNLEKEASSEKWTFGIHSPYSAYKTMDIILHSIKDLGFVINNKYIKNIEMEI